MQSRQVSEHPVRQLAVFDMNGGQERYHQFSQFSWRDPQLGLRCRKSTDASRLLTSGSGYVLMSSPSCV